MRDAVNEIDKYVKFIFRKKEKNLADPIKARGCSINIFLLPYSMLICENMFHSNLRSKVLIYWQPVHHCTDWLLKKGALLLNAKAQDIKSTIKRLNYRLSWQVWQIESFLAWPRAGILSEQCEFRPEAINLVF